MSDLSRIQTQGQGPGIGMGGAGVASRLSPSVRVMPPDRLPMRLLIGVVAAAGTVCLVWLFGVIGLRLGWSMQVRAPSMDASASDALATGVMILVGAPNAIFQAGVADPIRLLMGFVVIAIPAGALAAARPRTPGTPLPHPVYAAMANAGAVAALANGAGIVWWIGSAFRGGLLRRIPPDVVAASTWNEGLSVAAGLDTFAVAAAGLWVVLIFRLPIARWLRALAAVASFFSLVVALVAFAISSGAAVHSQSMRELVIVDAEPALRLGGVGPRDVLLRRSDSRLQVSIEEVPSSMKVVGLTTVPGFIDVTNAPDE